MRLIDADALKANAYDSGGWKSAEAGFHQMVVDIEDIEEAPTVDAVEVVRCGECAHNCGRVDGYICCDKTKEISIWHSEDWFCADGERREE